MDLGKYKNIYFIGIGGIGMSALARYFVRIGKTVSGYDKTHSQLTAELEAEGISIDYNEMSNLESFRTPIILIFMATTHP